MASKFRFDELAIALPGGFPHQRIRKVNKDYQHIVGWISSVGAGVAMNDLDGDGLSNDLCLTDPRIDQVVVTPAPGARDDRYRAFALDPAPLPMDAQMAPTGCVPGDYNADGRLDLLAYYMGRTPIIFLAREGVTALSPGAYLPVEVAAAPSGPGYQGARWQTMAAAVADFDGDGHEDLYFGNYFPDGPVLDPEADGGVVMQTSMSRASNGGEDHIFRWTAGTSGTTPTVTYDEAEGVLDKETSRGWVLGAGANDLDGDQLPELYLAHDFGTDRLLHNRSTPGKIRFAPAQGEGKPWTPNSKRIGADSFKGMGIDFGDLDRDGLYDMYVSNIATSFGLEESHFAFVSTAKDQKALGRALRTGKAPYEDRSAPLGVAWSGWGWDAKMADFSNSGDLGIVQTTGFVKGKVNRWALLQELATANDGVIANPKYWPKVEEDADIGGTQHLHFFVKGPDGRYTDLSKDLGLAAPTVTRGIAIGDVDGDGGLDFAVARQWDTPVFYRNSSPDRGDFLGLRLTHEGTGGTEFGRAGSPVVGAQVRAETADGRVFIGRVDGGSGHSGKRSHEVVLGLGDVGSESLDVTIQWRDRDGQVRSQSLRLTAGWHNFELGAQVKEATS